MGYETCKCSFPELHVSVALSFDRNEEGDTFSKIAQTVDECRTRFKCADADIVMDWCPFESDHEIATYHFYRAKN